MITIEVRLFNILATYAGEKHITRQLPQGSSLRQLLGLLAEEYGSSFRQLIFTEEGLSPYLRIFRDEELVPEADLDAPLSDGERIMLFPAVSGG